MNTILFDLDGTISDPIEGIHHSLNYALKTLGFEACDRKTVAQFIGPPLDVSFFALTGCSDKSKIAEFIISYREYFAETGYSENRLYPGIKEALTTLVENDRTLGLCTYKRKDFAAKILEMFNLSDHFSFISGGLIGAAKSEQIKTLLSDNLINTDSLMIGDRAGDIISAHVNGIASAGVLWGYGSRDELETEQPTFLFDNPTDLTRLVRH